MLLALFLIDLAAGLVLFLPLVGRRNAGVKFYRLVLIIAGVLAGGAAVARPLWLDAGVLVALTVFVYLMLRYPRRLVFRVPAVLLGAAYVVAASSVLLVLSATQTLGFAGVFIPIFVMIGSIGFIASNATSVAMAPFGERAGAASSLLGATQSAFGVAASAAVGWIGNRGPVPMATVMFACAATAFLAYALLVRKPRSSP